MSNLYGGTLRIDDGFSITINRFKNSMNGAGSALKKFTSESSRSSNIFKDKWSNAFSSIGRSSDKMTSKMVSNLKKITVTWLSVQSAVKTTKSIIEAGINVQNSKMYVDAVFGKSGNAVQKFRQAMDFASKTPFNSVEITNAMAKAQMLGLGTSKSDMDKYADLGSIAKLNGSGGIAEAVDAYADMMNGEFERMQTILGIKKRDLEQYAKDNNMGRFTNKQGQITNKDTLKQVFDSYIQSRGITGITEKYSQTLEGRLSTLTDNFKTSLAKIGGIQDDGTVRVGSLFDNFSKGVERTIKVLEKFGNSEAFNILQENLGKISGAFIDFIDSLTADPKKLQEIFDSIKNIVSGISDAGKYFMDIISIAPVLTKAAISYKYIIKPATSALKSIDSMLYNIAGFTSKDFARGIGAAVISGKGNREKAFLHETRDKRVENSIKRRRQNAILSGKDGIGFNESIFSKAVFNGAKFIGTKNSPFDNGSKNKSKSTKSTKPTKPTKSTESTKSTKSTNFTVRPDERATELIPYVKNEIKPNVKSGVNSGIKGSGLLAAIKGLSSKLIALGSIVASAAETVHSFLSTNGFIHNSINDIGGFFTGNYNKDYAARLYGNGIVKSEAWIANKLGILSNKDYKYAKKSIDNYIQNSDDYISGKTDKNPNIGRMGNYNPTNNVTVNIDKIEKDVDSDALIDKLSDIMDTWNDRNAIGTPIY